eukprot:725993_1
MDCEYPDLQKTVLATVEANEIGALLNRDVFTQTPILHSIVKTNNMEMCKIILPAIPDTHIFHCHDAFNRTFLEYAIYNGTTDCIKYLLDCLQSQAKTISIGQCIGEESMPGVSAFTKAYAEKNVEIIQLLVSYLKEEELHFAVQAAVYVDYDANSNANSAQELLSNVSSDELRYDLLHRCDSRGNTLFKAAIDTNNAKFVSWFLNVVKGDDIILMKPNDTWGGNAWMGCNDSSSATMEAVFNRFEPKSRLQHVLMMDFSRESLLRKTGWRKKTDSVFNIITSALTQLAGDIDDIDTASPLFRFAVSNNNMECTKLILSKTTQSIKNELLINSKTIHKEKNIQSMLQMLTNEIQNTDIMTISNDDNDLHFKEPSVFHTYWQRCDMKCVNMLLSVYDECKESYQDANILQMIIQKTRSGANVFDAARDKKTKQVLNECMSSIIDNIQTNDEIDCDSFMPYFQWLIKENELDSIRKLFDTLSHNQFTIKALLYQHANTKQNAVHIACTHNHIEILKYLLSFIRSSAEHQQRLLLSVDTKQMTPFMISCSRGFIKCASLLLQTLKSNPKVLSS